MKTAVFLVFAAALVAFAPCAVTQQPKGDQVGAIERLDPRFDKLIPKDAKIVKVAEGFIWTEGVCWIPDKGILVFSDIPNNVINAYTPGKGVTVHLKNSGSADPKGRGGKPGDEPGSNGLRLDPEGRLTICEHGDRRVTRIEKDGTKKVLADKYEGKRLNSPNDLVYKSNGDLYFTDPPYGLKDGWKDPARELDFCGVYRVTKDGKITLLTKEMTRPNGIAFSADEKTLYVANSDPEKAVWMAFDVKDDGTLGKSRVFHDATKWVGRKLGLPDGMKIDKEGNLFATGPGGVWVFAPDGTHLGNIDPQVATANCAFGEDGSVLYLAADHWICRVQTSTKGK
ncbi:MAG TPA: SMP-30/gluconolactonase/LRE family protein [Gemmataceae bacterium]|nr:SMP-30/gluconolactonase/LRE family protein [Gemmataceae bacterium]